MQENAREISIIKKRILQFAERQHISKYEIYQKTGISNGVLSQKGGISEDNLLKFLSYYNNVSERWLLTGNEPMINDFILPEINNGSNSQLEMIVKLSAENALLKKENEELKSKKKYANPTNLSIASEP